MAFPKNGPLSGMIIVALAALFAVVGGLLGPVRDVFSAPASPALLDAFGVTVGLMAVHKAESWFAGEHRRCPVYLTQIHAAGGDPGRLLFQGFAPTVVAALFVAWLLMIGPPWTLLLLTIWCAQGVHEWHHLAKTAVEARYYPGTVSAAVFVGAMNLWFVPEWAVLLRADSQSVLYAYYAAQPLLIAGYVLEHRRWTSRWSRWTAAEETCATAR